MVRFDSSVSWAVRGEGCFSSYTLDKVNMRVSEKPRIEVIEPQFVTLRNRTAMPQIRGNLQIRGGPSSSRPIPQTIALSQQPPSNDLAIQVPFWYPFVIVGSPRCKEVSCLQSSHLTAVAMRMLQGVRSSPFPSFTSNRKHTRSSRLISQRRRSK